MEGPDEKMLFPLVKQGLTVLVGMMDDPVVQVKDSAAFALGRICENVSEAIDPEEHLPGLIGALFSGLTSSPKMASSCCWALMNLAERFSGEAGAQTNHMSPHFQESVQRLLAVTEETEADSQLRTAAYEVLNAFVASAANDSLPTVAKLSEVILERLEKTVPMQQQIVSVEDRITLEEIQTSLTSVLLAIVQRLDGEIKPAADRIMNVLLQILSSVGAKSSVPDTVFAVVGSLANALEEDFAKYMESFLPFLHNALGNREEPGLCAMAIGLVSDIVRGLGELSAPYCDQFMNYLLQNLSVSSSYDRVRCSTNCEKDKSISNQFRPAILQTFGDIAQAIGPHFETYLSVVAQVLQTAASVTMGENAALEMFDYVVSLREGVMDAWSGAILAMKSKRMYPKRKVET
jgi:importin subunit beta-1